ncbi:MAG: CPBP family intramembrane metalloprotease [Candidatus Izemoplasma sp.]
MTKKHPDFSIILFYFLSLILLIIVQIILLFSFDGLLNNVGRTSVKFDAISNLAWYLLLFTVYLVFFKDYLLEQFKLFFSRIDQSIGYIILGLFIMFAGAVASVIILFAIVGDEPAENQEAIERIFNGDWFDQLSIVISTVIFAPLVEELFFRKALFNVFSGKKKKQLSIFRAFFVIVLSSFTFGLVHVLGDNPAQIIYYFALGLGLGFTYYISKRNFFVVVSMHMIVNGLVTYFMFLEL